jgi:hypothetical protein
MRHFGEKTENRHFRKEVAGRGAIAFAGVKGAGLDFSPDRNPGIGLAVPM